MFRRLLDRLMYRPAGGAVGYNSPTDSIPIRLTRGIAVITRPAWESYGEDFFTRLLPDTDFVIVEEF